MELATRTSALRVIEHRLRDAVLYWEEGEASGGAPVSESTATGKRAGNPSTAEIACHIAGALYLVLCDAHALQGAQCTLRDPPPCWGAAGCSAKDTRTQVGEKISTWITGPGVFHSTNPGMTIAEHGLHAARFVLTVCRIPHAQKWRDSVGTFGPPRDARGNPIIDP